MNSVAAESNRWKIATAILGLVLVIVLVVVGWNQFGPSKQGASSETPSKSAAPTTASSAPTPTTDTASADGCLGGSDPQTAVLAAQREAPLTGPGAAAFAASLERWSTFAPRSDDKQDQKTLRQIAGGPVLATYVKAGYIAKAPKGTIRNWAETKGDHYRIVSVEPRQVVVDVWITGNYQMESLKTEQSISGGRYEFRANGDDQWVWWKAEQPATWKDTVAEDYRGAQEYVGGC